MWTPIHCRGCFKEMEGIHGPLPCWMFCKDCVAQGVVQEFLPAGNPWDRKRRGAR